MVRLEFLFLRALFFFVALGTLSIPTQTPSETAFGAVAFEMIGSGARTSIVKEQRHDSNAEHQRDHASGSIFLVDTSSTRSTHFEVEVCCNGISEYGDRRFLILGDTD